MELVAGDLTFQTIDREASVGNSLLDAVCGHAPPSGGGSYGTFRSRRKSALSGLPWTGLKGHPQQRPLDRNSPTEAFLD
jgi:hypothetical protein